MKIEELVLSIEQAKYLQELGLDMSDAALWWIQYNDGGWKLIDHKVGLAFCKSSIPTYTLHEMLNRLPETIEGEYYLVPSHGNIEYSSIRYGVFISFDMTFFDPIGVYDMLCWVLEHGYLKEERL